MKRDYTLKSLITLTLLASALSCIVTAIVIFIGMGVFSPRFKYVREYSNLLRQIDKLYIGQYDRKTVRDASMDAAVDAIGDKWSYYLSQEEYEDYLSYTSNSYAGIGVGVEIDAETGGMLILYTYKNSAAEIAGVLPGDIITKIDGKDIGGLILNEMKDLLLREIGETVELTVIRTDGTTEVLTAEYSYVFTPPVYYELLENDVGYIALSNFARGSADSFIEAVADLQVQGAASIVFDVRNNGGGRVNEMTKILDFLLPEGEIFVAVSKKGRETTTLSDSNSFDIPAAVLVNEFSYSAAEYFAATLSEYGYACIVGAQTTGKNRSQITIELPGGGALHISSGEYLTKNRVSLYNEGGLTPEYVVEMSDEDMTKFAAGKLDYADDMQLQKAISLLTTE